jgi:hypothetical protein
MASTKTRDDLTYVRVTSPRRVCLHVAQPVPVVEAALLPTGVGSSKVVPAAAPSLLYRCPNLTSRGAVGRAGASGAGAARGGGGGGRS